MQIMKLPGDQVKLRYEVNYSIPEERLGFYNLSELKGAGRTFALPTKLLIVFCSCLSLI
jgi:hypothetical protein